MKRLILISLFIAGGMYFSSCNPLCKQNFTCYGSLYVGAVGFDSLQLDTALVISTNAGISDTQILYKPYFGYPYADFIGDTGYLNITITSDNDYTIIFPTAGATYSVTLTAPVTTSSVSYPCQDGSYSGGTPCTNTITSYTVNGQTFIASSQHPNCYLVK